MTDWPRTTPLGIIELMAFGKAADLARHASFPRRLRIRWPETHRRAQPLRTEARNAKKIRKSPIPGIFARETAPTGGVFCVAAFGIAKPRSRGKGRNCLRRTLGMTLAFRGNPAHPMPVRPADDDRLAPHHPAGNHRVHGLRQGDGIAAGGAADSQGTVNADWANSGCRSSDRTPV